MRSLPEVQEELEAIERDLARLQHPLASAAEECKLAQGRADAAQNAFIAEYSGPGWKAKSAAASANAGLVSAALAAEARLEKGKYKLKVMEKRLEALRSANASLNMELQVLRGGHGP